MQKKTHFVSFCIMVTLIFFAVFYVIKIANTMTVSIRAITEDAIGESDILSDSIKIPVKESLHQSTWYEATIQYEIVEQKGHNFFYRPWSRKTRTGNLAVLGCSPLKTKTTFFTKAAKVEIMLNMTIVPSGIVSETGSVFDPKTQKLQPVISIKEISNGYD